MLNSYNRFILAPLIFFNFDSSPVSKDIRVFWPLQNSLDLHLPTTDSFPWKWKPAIKVGRSFVVSVTSNPALRGEKQHIKSLACYYPHIRQSCRNLKGVIACSMPILTCAIRTSRGHLKVREILTKMRVIEWITSAIPNFQCSMNMLFPSVIAHRFVSVP